MLVTPDLITTDLISFLPKNGDASDLKSYMSPVPLIVSTPFESSDQLKFSPHLPDVGALSADAVMLVLSVNTSFGSAAAEPKIKARASKPDKIFFFIFILFLLFSLMRNYRKIIQHFVNKVNRRAFTKRTAKNSADVVSTECFY